MSNRSIIIAEEPITSIDPPETNRISCDPEATHLVATLTYNPGGINYATYDRDIRGYYVSFTPQKIAGNTRSFMMLSGKKVLVQQATRFSKPTLDRLAGQVRQLHPYRNCRAAVIRDHGLTLADESAAA